jgi:hypothetical protein
LDGNDLLGALYVHYCKALDRQVSPILATWVSAAPSAGTGQPADVARADEKDGHAGGLISGLFPDIECVDEAFGPLVSGVLPDHPDNDRAPEILRLFAPPEYEAKGRLDAVLPPALTRREHHALSIDSPMTGIGHATGDIAERDKTGNV